MLTEYFGYDVQYVMNITDIDDKIIRKARQEYLFTEYTTSSSKSVEEILTDAKSVLKWVVDQEKNINDPDKKTMFAKMVQKLEAAIKVLENSTNAKEGINVEDKLKVFFLDGKDLISNWLDQIKGHDVSDHSIFSSLSKFWESAFHKDMSDLNVCIGYFKFLFFFCVCN